MAKAFFDKLSSSKNKSDSAGTKVFEREGQIIKNLGESAQMVIKAMKEEGIDISECKRKQITPEMIKKADKVILIAEKENIPDELFNNNKALFWNVEDPLNVNYDALCQIRDKLKQMVKELLA